MARKKRTIAVVSIGNVKCDGKYYPPGKEWDCPHDLVGALEEVDAVERIRVVQEKASPAPKNPPAGGKGKTPPAGNDDEGSAQDDAAAGSGGDAGDQE